MLKWPFGTRHPLLNGMALGAILALWLILLVKARAQDAEQALRQAITQLRDELPDGVEVPPGFAFYEPTNHYQFLDPQEKCGVHDRTYNISLFRSRAEVLSEARRDPKLLYYLGKPLEPHGNANLEFPWKTGGADESPNASSRVFRWFPRGEKILYWRAGTPDGYYRWEFPIGTVFGEVLYVDKRPFEVRIMTKGYPKWKFQVFRPYATRADVEQYITSSKRTAFQLTNHPIEQIETAGGRIVARSRHPWKTVLNETNLRDEIVMTRAGVDEVLSRKFRDVTDVPWAEHRGFVAYAPYTVEEGQIVPAKFMGHHFQAKTCAKCHDTCGQDVDVFDPERDWYGNVRGSDSVFTWSPFARASKNGRTIPIEFSEEARPLLKRWEK